MMRHGWLGALVLALGAVPAGAVPAGELAAEPICAFGSDEASYRQEAFCTAQVALRSTIARSFALLSARMAAQDDGLGTLIRRVQDADARAELLIRQERGARADGQDAAKLADIGNRLDGARAELAAARTALETSHPQWVALTRPRAITEAETSALLRPGEAMVFWLVGDDETFVFAIDRRGATWERIGIGREALERSILQLRDMLGVSGPVRGALAMPQGGRDLQALKSRGLALHRQLFPDSVDKVARRADTLLLVPSGPLSGLPFAVLPTSEGRDPHWLGLTKSLALMPSPADLRTLRGRPSAPQRATEFIGYGAPVLNSAGPPVEGETRVRSAIAGLPPLPDAEGELRALAAALGAPSSAVRIGNDATERAVKAADLASARIIAFATHGLVAGEVQGVGEGALVLTPPDMPDTTDDGLLTASEAAQLKLDADWVILSACSTAAGDRVGGDALSGLASAFAYAGARTLLVSHWQVRDDAARRLTTLSVTERRRGSGEALRRAMHAVANDPDHPAWRDPAVWGVMTLIGDPAR